MGGGVGIVTADPRGLSRFCYFVHAVIYTQRRSINVIGQWVTINQKKEILLPESRSVSAVAFHGNDVAIGSASGPLTTLKFDFED